MRMILIAAAAIFVWLGTRAGAYAQAPNTDAVALKVGDPAPGLTPGKWIKGEPVTKFEKDKIYVVEFWATWCGPCKISIPHISKLQEQYKDVTFVGQDCLEQDQAVVPDFVKQMGDEMNYRVALDDVPGNDGEKGKMQTAWMTAAGQDGIPTAFVIDKQTKIAWIGHPMELDDVLKDIVAGTFDPKKAAAQKEAVEKLEEKFDTAIHKHDIDGALAIDDELAVVQPSMAEQLATIKFDLLLVKKDYAAASELGKKLAQTFKDKPGMLNALAWTIVSPEQPVEKPDLDLAEAMASRAVEITKGEDGGMLDTLARVYFVRGNIDKAIETQTKALSKATKQEKSDLEKNMDEYQAAKDKAGKPDAK